MKVAFLIPYYGAFPNYFNLWLHSASNNPNFDFIFFSDIDCSSYAFPSNVQVNPIPFDALKTKIQDKFDFEICLDDPYKLCDFKPAYGYIFEEYLREYDLWGFIDIDLILGRIADFIPSETLQEFDIIGCHGHFTLFRNNEHVNNFFMTEPKSGEVGFDKAFSARHCFLLDDSGFFANAS